MLIKQKRLIAYHTEYKLSNFVAHFETDHFPLLRPKKLSIIELIAQLKMQTMEKNRAFATKAFESKRTLLPGNNKVDDDESKAERTILPPID